MNYPFSLYGNQIKVHRFLVNYTYTLEYKELPKIAEDDFETTIVPIIKTEECKNSRAFPTREEAEDFKAHNGGEIQELDTSAYEWLDGIKVADVPDTYAEAVKLYEMGQAAYEALQNKPTPEETIATLESQVTDLQMALCDMYETMEVMRS